MPTLRSAERARGYTHFRTPTLDQFDLDDLSDVTLTTEADGDYLRWNGSAWVNEDPEDRFYTEAEVDALLLEDGTATGNTLYWDSSSWTETDAIEVDPSGAVTLRAAGDEILEVNQGGSFAGGWIDIKTVDSDDKAWLIFKGGGTGATGGALITHFSDGNMYVDNRRNSGQIRMRCWDSGGSADTVLVAAPEDGVTLYYDNTPQLRTESGGAGVIRKSSDAPVMSWWNADGTTRNLYIQGNNGGNVDFRNEVASGTIRLQTETAGGTARTTLQVQDAGIVADGATGGAKGRGTINAVGVYDDNTLLTDYVFDAELDGSIDTSAYDDTVPDREERDAEDRPISTQRRTHEPARRFVQKMDDLDPEQYALKWKDRRKLPAFDTQEESLSVGEYAQRLLETCEVQAVHIEKLRERVTALESAQQSRG